MGVVVDSSLWVMQESSTVLRIYLGSETDPVYDLADTAPSGGMPTIVA